MKRVQEGVIPGNEGLDGVWGPVLDLLAPWIQPLDNNGQILSSWTSGDSELAEGMVVVWLESVTAMQNSFKGEEEEKEGKSNF